MSYDVDMDNGAMKDITISESLTRGWSCSTGCDLFMECKKDLLSGVLSL